MKYLRFALFAFVAALGIAHAQDEEDRRTPPVEIPDFSNLDEYIYEPKSTVVLGFRYLNGAKTSFSGTGKIAAPEDFGSATGANQLRSYRNGVVQPDTRATSRFDDVNGVTVFDPIAPDGKTNTWSFATDSQITSDGYVSFNAYSAAITDTGLRSKSANATSGLDLAVMRDMGTLLGSRIKWNLTAGLSVNDIASAMNDKVRADVTTLTDYYFLFGQKPPAAPYQAPSSASVTVVDANGNPTFNSDGSTQTVTVDTTVLLANQPTKRDIITASDSSSVSNRWKVKGAYYTFRVGPTVWIPITSRFRASVSLGAALVYSGTSYTVTESFQPAIGDVITDTDTSTATKLLPGYYADATLQFDVTDHAGLYAGAVFQSAGSYTQEVVNSNLHYATKIDLGNTNGLRAGMTIRF